MSKRDIAAPAPATRLLTFFAAGALALTACDGGPTQVGEDHVEAGGFVIESEGEEILRYLDAQGGTPALTLQASTVYEVAVVFLDADGDPLEHEEQEPGEAEDELRVTIGNGSVLAWTAEEHDEEEHEHVEFHGELEALVAGSTTMQLCILHEGHCDYESPLVQVEVE